MSNNFTLTRVTAPAHAPQPGDSVFSIRISGGTEICPMCDTPGAVNTGDIHHCDACGHHWYVKSDDIEIDVTETHPAVILLREWLVD